MDTMRMRFEHRHLDVACTLTAEELGDRGDEWQRLRDEHLLATEPIPGGARLWLTAGSFDTAADLARRECECCGFLDLEMARNGERVRLDITSQSPEAAPVIEALAGTGERAPGCC